MLSDSSTLNHTNCVFGDLGLGFFPMPADHVIIGSVYLQRDQRNTNLLVTSHGRKKITKRRNLPILIRPLMFHAIFNKLTSDLLGEKGCSWFCTLVYAEFMNLPLVC